MNPHKKFEDILLYSALILVLLLLNIHSAKFFFRLDMTQEKRFQISQATQTILKDLEEPVYIEVYLEGDLNASFKQFQKNIREILNEFKVYAGKKLEFKFTNPDEASNEKARNLFYKELQDRGIMPTNLFDKVDGKKTEKIIFPGAWISYKGRGVAANLLKGNRLSTPEQQLNQSAEGLEYEFAAAIAKLGTRQRQTVAFLKGQDQLEPIEVADISRSLSEFYVVERIEAQDLLFINPKVLIIAQPKSAFSDTSLFYIDQYLMKGGSLAVFLDKVQMNLDSLDKGGNYAFGYDLGIESLLFKYGVRVNMDMIQDQQMGFIEVQVGNLGNKANIQRQPWPYYVDLTTFADHPISRNLDVISARFLSTIDTIKSSKVRKTPLLFSSQFTRVKKAPTMVSLDELRMELQKERFDKGNLAVAYLLEGEFDSYFSLRFPPKGVVGETQVLKQSPKTKVLVVSDGDMLRNEIDKRTGRPMPLEFDAVRRRTLSNKDFVLNVVSYMVEQDGIIVSRNKKISMRPLNTFAVEEQAKFWQVFNIGLPVILILIFGWLWGYLRKKKYASN
jgi:gliding-associated putative ABC transporter substrate-binding component GldG